MDAGLCFIDTFECHSFGCSSAPPFTDGHLSTNVASFRIIPCRLSFFCAGQFRGFHVNFASFRIGSKDGKKHAPKKCCHPPSPEKNPPWRFLRCSAKRAIHQNRVVPDHLNILPTDHVILLAPQDSETAQPAINDNRTEPGVFRVNLHIADISVF